MIAKSSRDMVIYLMSDKLGYKETYLQVVRKEHLEDIKKILKERKYFDDAVIDGISIDEKEELPYLSVWVNSPEITGHLSYAMVDSVFIEIHSIVPQWTEVFYLPILFLRGTKNEKVNRLINVENQRQHEQRHVFDIIQYIETDPGYIERAMKYNAGCSTADNFRESIELEVSKIFRLEVPAYRLDYSNGERDHFFYSNGVASQIKIDSMEKFVKANISTCISRLHDFYTKRFPEKEESVKNHFKEVVNEQGKEIFGSDGMTQIAFSLLELLTLSKNSAYATQIEVGDLKDG